MFDFHELAFTRFGLLFETDGKVLNNLRSYLLFDLKSDLSTNLFLYLGTKVRYVNTLDCTLW
jgi:hypothetical protein